MLIRTFVQWVVFLTVVVGLLPVQTGAQVDFPIGYVSARGYVCLYKLD